jgi:hypothetical protein
MKPDRFGDQLEQFRRWLIGRHWSDTVIRLSLVGVLSQIVVLLFGLGLGALVWVYTVLNF